MKRVNALFTWCMVTLVGSAAACGGQTNGRSSANGGASSGGAGPYVAGGGAGAGISTARGGSAGAGTSTETGGVASTGESSGLVGIGVAGRGATDAGGTTSRDAGMRCTPIVRPAPCSDSIVCIDDLRAVASRFSTCSNGPTGVPYLARCGQYDTIVVVGEDSRTTVFFDHADGHLVAIRSDGNGGSDCQSEDPSFEAPQCDIPDPCPFEDAGAGG